MCNQGSDPLLPEMESLPSSPAPPADETLRVKFLCSFGGCILPRPLDGRLRYVGGETRIVSVSRDVTYDELLNRMRELYEGTAAIKYQQPDEDLDALVSVVNNDDVMNMMEECDKLGSAGEGFTRLRVFLFSYQNPEIDPIAAATTHFEVDGRETERRYVDALNSLNDARQSYQTDAAFQLPIQALDTGLPNHLHLLNIPHPSHVPRYGETEGQWSPAYYSPRHRSPQDPRELSSPPPSARQNIVPGELLNEDFARHYPGYQPHQYDHLCENSSYFPPSGNLGYSNHVNAMEGTSICDHCRMAFQRFQPQLQDPRLHDLRWKQVQPQMDQCGVGGNEYGSQLQNSCSDCHGRREGYVLAQDTRMDHGTYAREHYEHRAYHEYHAHDRNWGLQYHPPSHHIENPRLHLHGSSRVADRYIFEGGGIDHPMPAANINHDDPRYISSGITDTGNGVCGQLNASPSSYLHVPNVEDTAMRFGNQHSGHGLDSHNIPPIRPLWRNNALPAHSGTSYGTMSVLVTNSVSPRFSHTGGDGPIQNRQSGSFSHNILGFDGLTPDYTNDPGQISNPNIIAPESRLPLFLDSVQCQHIWRHVEIPSATMPKETSPPCNPSIDKVVVPTSRENVGNVSAHANSTGFPEIVSTVATFGQELSLLDKETEVCLNPGTKIQQAKFDSNGPKAKEEQVCSLDHSLSGTGAALELADITPKRLSFLPELIASVKKAVLESAEEVKLKAQEDADLNRKEPSLHISEPGVGLAEVEADVEDDHPKIAKIEPTTAEAEAMARGLQTIKNDDLEEIRLLGSGTFGSVYHGKWKGSDVAIKRIKSSCFDGKPSERQRLIADFWKEALLMSSLHHPNVVSFYGVVRDSPDGCLATVTEFMVNGSLKKFLQKKDRTIDRRKRLILAMDAAFGMEYLHGKNVVHFDLKCENLLVNMRDPQRPICKIGDLGLSKVKQHTLVSGGVRGTLPWMAPELLSGKSNMVSEKIDVYSFGIVMWELLTGEEPYADMHCASIIGGIVTKSLRPQTPTWCDPEWKSLMESCWSSDPAERPSFSEISKKLRSMAAAINVK